MGKRKLTKILLKSNCKADLNNIQNDTPMDIAKRKDYTEIINILYNNIPYIIHKDQMARNMFYRQNKFSPYGCHSSLDSRYILFSNTELLTKIKLERGEQYYFDLTGNVQKGPMCVMNKCYCNPLIKHKH